MYQEVLKDRLKVKDRRLSNKKNFTFQKQQLKRVTVTRK